MCISNSGIIFDILFYVSESLIDKFLLFKLFLLVTILEILIRLMKNNKLHYINADRLIKAGMHYYEMRAVFCIII